MRCEAVLTNIFREIGCNEGLYHCLADDVAGCQERLCVVKPEIKSDHCLTHHQCISQCLTVSIMCCLRLRKYLLREITSLSVVRMLGMRGDIPPVYARFHIRFF